MKYCDTYRIVRKVYHFTPNFHSCLHVARVKCNIRKINLSPNTGHYRVISGLGKDFSVCWPRYTDSRLKEKPGQEEFRVTIVQEWLVISCGR
jgi:hypothetical protein